MPLIWRCSIQPAEAWHGSMRAHKHCHERLVHLNWNPGVLRGGPWRSRENPSRRHVLLDTVGPCVPFGVRSVWTADFWPFDTTVAADGTASAVATPPWPLELPAPDHACTVPVDLRLRNCCCASGVLHPRPDLPPSVILRDCSGLHRRLLAPEDACLHCWWAV